MSCVMYIPTNLSIAKYIGFAAEVLKATEIYLLSDKKTHLLHHSIYNSGQLKYPGKIQNRT